MKGGLEVLLGGRLGDGLGRLVLGRIDGLSESDIMPIVVEVYFYN